MREIGHGMDKSIQIHGTMKKEIMGQIDKENKPTKNKLQMRKKKRIA